MARDALGEHSSPGVSVGGGGSERGSEPEGETGAGVVVAADPVESSRPLPHAGEVAESSRTEGAVTVRSSLADLPDHLTGVILANELVDNLPVAIAVRTEEGWRERWVGADGDQLALVDAPARREIVEWCDRFAGPCPVDGFVEVQLAAAEWLRTALAKLDRGAVLLIDYGDTAENLEPRRTEGTLRTYRAHHLGPHPLDEPGETDITSDVNFTALQTIAEEAGGVVGYHRQDDFLASLGLRDRLSQLRRDELALAQDGDPMERLKVRSLKNEVETLLHPRGLGDFRVLVARVD
jgi:SAM-dependent MidA family methyltransferase